MKILFVDDEKIIREGIQNLINWKACDCEELCTAANALEAIDLLESYKAELVITDIYMPEMTGIEFAKLLKERYPNIKVIILSGYENFSYAREAIEAGVLKYLLKPVFPEELEKAIKEAHQEIRKQITYQAKVEESQKIITMYQPIIVQVFWKDMLQGKISSEEQMIKRAQQAGITLPEGKLLCIYVSELNRSEKQQKQGQPLYLILKNVIEHVFRDMLLELLEMDEGQVAIVLNSTPGKDKLEKVRETVSENSNRVIHLAVGNLVEDITLLPQSAQTAQKISSFCGLIGQSGVFYPDDIQMSKLDIKYPKDIEYKIVEMISFNDTVNVGLVHDFITYLVENRVDFQGVTIMLLQLMMAIYEAERKVKDTDIEPFYKKYVQLSSFKCISEFEQFLVQWMEEIMLQKRQKYLDDTEVLIDRAISLINSNFKNETFCVNDIAQQLHVSASYLSRTFHKQTGRTCIEYITRTRIDEAKQILKNSSMKSYHIANAVGYSNVYYFGLQFKKVTGMTPGEYRKLVVNKNAQDD